MSLKNMESAMTVTPNKLRVFLDADVIFAGSASPQEHSASHVVLLMGEITLLDCITSQQAVTEVERNLGKKLPAKLPEFRLLVSRCLRVVDDPTAQELLKTFRCWLRHCVNKQATLFLLMCATTFQPIIVLSSSVLASFYVLCASF